VIPPVFAGFAPRGMCEKNQRVNFVNDTSSL
jgi:hypothetical protein